MLFCLLNTFEDSNMLPINYKFFVCAFLLSILSIQQLHANEAPIAGKILGTAPTEIPDWFKESFLDFREDAIEAAEEGKHMLVFADLKGCPYCAKMLEDSFKTSVKDGGNKEFIQENFDAIHINIKGSREVTFDDNLIVPEKKLAEALKVKFTPTMLFMNADNKIVSRISGYRSPREFQQVLNYVKEKAYETTDFPSYRKANLTNSVYELFPHNKFTKISDFKKALDTGKPLAILFEDKTCDDCARFHKETLDLPDTHAQMAKFNFVRLDALSDEEIIDTDGNKTTASDWLAKKGISYRPAVLLFGDGKLRADVTGMIKSHHFQQMLAYVGDKKFKEYETWLDYEDVVTAQMLKSGKNVDIWK
jgi:thioredoxin-related protein